MEITLNGMACLKRFLHRKIIEHSFVPKESGFHGMSMTVVRNNYTVPIISSEGQHIYLRYQRRTEQLFTLDEGPRDDKVAVSLIF